MLGKRGRMVYIVVCIGINFGAIPGGVTGMAGQQWDRQRYGSLCSL
jgi:hypothetical protein